MSKFPAHVRRHIVVLTLVAAALLFVHSCSVRDELILSPDGSGEAHVNVDIHPVLLAYLTDLMTAMTGAEGDLPIFDLDQLRASFQERPGVTLLGAEMPERGALRLRVAFQDINQLFADEESADTVHLTSSGTRRQLVVTLDRNAVRRFLGFAPQDSSMLADILLPPEDGSLSTAEYRDELEWAFEEYGDGGEVADALDGSAIEVTVRPRGRIISQSGGSVSGDAVVFRIPVLELLTLDQERVYSVTFAP